MEIVVHLDTIASKASFHLIFSEKIPLHTIANPLMEQNNSRNELSSINADGRLNW